MEAKPLITPPTRQRRHPRYDAIHRALLTGLLSNVGTRTETHEYQGGRGVRFHIFPGSALFGQKQKWIMAGELVETTKLYARTCAAVEPAWIERVADHLVERTYSEPRWEIKTASVVATERVTLNGLVLVAARTVPYAPINPRQCRELFIHHALVLGEYLPPRSDAPFFRHNARLVEEVQTLEAKIRQRNLLADAATRHAFYEARVPQEVTGGADFETWRRRAERQHPRLLYMDKADLLRADAPAITPANYPDRIAEDLGGKGHLELPVTYRFEPGEVTDGLTLTVPVAALAQLRAERYEWLVPGMLEEKISSLLRELPGTLRRNFVPVPAWARGAAEALAGVVRQEEAEGRRRSDGTSAGRPAPQVSLREALATYLARQTGVEIGARDLSEANLAPHLRMAFKVMDDQGRVLGVGRDLVTLQRKFAALAAGSFATIYQRGFNREQVTAWDFGDLPESVSVQRFKMTITAYPALADQGDSCALRLLPTKELAESSHRAGVRRLFRLDYRKDVKGLSGHFPHFGQIALQHYTLGDSRTLREELVTLTADRALFAEDGVPRKQAEYEALRHKAAVRLTATGDAVANLAAAVFQNYHTLTLALDAASRAGGSGAVDDVRDQLAHLMPARFLLATPWEWLGHFPRYLAAMELRLAKLEKGGRDVQERDWAGMEAVAPWWNKYLHRRQQHDEMGIVDPELALFRWMIEEYRVHLFSQELGTLLAVSQRRMEKQWEKTRKDE